MAEGAVAFVRLNTAAAGDAVNPKPHKARKDGAATLAAEQSPEQSETEEGAGAVEAARAASDVEEEELVSDWRQVSPSHTLAPVAHVCMLGSSQKNVTWLQAIGMYAL